MKRPPHRWLLWALPFWTPPVLAAGQSTPAGAELGAGYLVQLVLGLLVVVALIAALGWVLRRVGRLQMGTGDKLRVIAALSVGARERAVLVQVGEEQLLLGVAAGQVRLLHALKDPLPAPTAAGGTQNGAFAAKLAAALKQRTRR